MPLTVCGKSTLLKYLASRRVGDKVGFSEDVFVHYVNQEVTLNEEQEEWLPVYVVLHADVQRRLLLEELKELESPGIPGASIIPFLESLGIPRALTIPRIKLLSAGRKRVKPLIIASRGTAHQRVQIGISRDSQIDMIGKCASLRKSLVSRD